MIKETFVPNGEIRIWTTVDGTDTPLMLCNGGPGCCDYLEPVSDMINDICTVIRFEERGCGRTSFIPPYTYEQSIDDLEAIRKYYGVERWIVAGHSAGVDLALAYALKYPQNVIALVGIAGGRIVNDREWSKAYHEGLETVGERLPEFKYPCDPQVNIQGNAYWKRYITRPTLLKEIAQLQIPALFINAGRDIRPGWPTQQLAHLLPQGRYTEIAEAEHCIWLTHADELKDILRDFLCASVVKQ